MAFHMNPPLSLQPIEDRLFAVVDAQDQHVGNLKRIGSLWKFKALGHTAEGLVVPGGGPLTDRHNTVFDQADASVVNTVLLGR